MSTSNHHITVAAAADMTSRYREVRPDNFAICETFEADAISLLLSNTSCHYLRIYYGMTEDNEVHAILVGADETGEDILPPESAGTESAETSGAEGPLEDGYRCPQYCPPPSKLNS